MVIICPHLPSSPVSSALCQMLVGVGWGVCCSQENNTLAIAVKALGQTRGPPGPGWAGRRSSVEAGVVRSASAGPERAGLAEAEWSWARGWERVL